MDQDYIDKLDGKSKEWLSRFNIEYYGNTFKKGSGAHNLHVKDKHKLVYDQTNARNRDIFNQRYRLYDNPEWGGMDYYGTSSPEDALIEAMDRRERIQTFISEALEVENNSDFLEQLTRFVFNIGE